MAGWLTCWLAGDLAGGLAKKKPRYTNKPTLENWKIRKYQQTNMSTLEDLFQ
jgi:hypothetical protein